MRNTHYCVSCGESISFSTERPKFCPVCGTPQTTAAANKLATRPQAEEQDDSFSGSVEVEKIIRTLAGKVQPLQGIKIGAVYGTAQEGEEDYARPPMSKEAYEEKIAFLNKRHNVIEFGDKETDES